MEQDNFLAAVNGVVEDDARFQQLTMEDSQQYGSPELVLLNPIPSNDPASSRKRQNWMDWRAAPYPAERHSEYLFRSTDLNSDHPRILLSAVLDVSTGLDAYLSQFNKKQRYKIKGNKANNAGFQTKIIRPSDHSSDIWNIIHSSEQRQGRDIAESYDNRSLDYDFPDYLDFLDPHYRDICVGCFSPEGKMVAYILGKRVGDHVQYDEIMAHSDYVAYHVMFLTHYAFLCEILKLEEVPKCLNYGPWYSGVDAFSAQGGLNYWKRKTRFRPAYLITAYS